eukprot:9254404-Alexandrium_andersonii.AAC.1
MCIRDRIRAPRDLTKDQTLLDAQRPDLLGKTAPPSDGAPGRPDRKKGKKSKRSASTRIRRSGRDRSPEPAPKAPRPPADSNEVCRNFNDGLCKPKCPFGRKH